MKNILTILSQVIQHINIFESKKGTAEIKAFIEVREDDVQEIFEEIESLGGEWYVLYNSDGDIGIGVIFKTTVDSEYIKAAKLINRHWFETRFDGNRGELLKYCEDILTVSK